MQVYGIIMNCPVNFQSKKFSQTRHHSTNFRNGTAKTMMFAMLALLQLAFKVLASSEASSELMMPLSLSYQSVIPPSTLSYGAYQQLRWELALYKIEGVFLILPSGPSLSSGKGYSFIGFRQQWKERNAVLWCVHRNKGRWNHNTGKRQQCSSEILQAI